MINVVGVRFQNTGKSYYFDPLEFSLKRGTHVIVETARGKEFGTITIPPILVQDDKVVQPLRPILRIATEEDEERNAENKEKSKEAGKICVEKIARYGLEMKLVETEYTFDRSKLLFYFTADGRVDFRELVKDLASVFRTRIELRQIGVRDETKIKGGLGMCGRELCCTTFLSDFAPVSIRMAKEQNLSLNPSKISGACGRLMCCLKNEQETYEYLNKQLPKVGQRVNTIDQIEGTVQSVNILKQTAKVVLDMNGEKEIREYAAGEMAYGDRDFTCEPRSSQEDDLDYFAQQLKIAVAAAKDPEEEQRRAKDERRNSSGRNPKKRSAQDPSKRSGDLRHPSEQKQGAEGKQRTDRRGAKPGLQSEGDSHSDGKRQKSDRAGDEPRQHGGRTGDGKRRQNDRRSGERRQQAGRSGGSQKQRAQWRDSDPQANQSGQERKQHSDNRSDEPKRRNSETRVRSGENRSRSEKKRTGSRPGGENDKNALSGEQQVSAKSNAAAGQGGESGTGDEKRQGDGTRQQGRKRSRYRGNRNREKNPADHETTGTKQADS